MIGAAKPKQSVRINASALKALGKNVVRECRHWERMSFENAGEINASALKALGNNVVRERSLDSADILKSDPTAQMAPTRAIRRWVASNSGEDFSQAIAAVDSSSESSVDAGADGGPDNSGSDGGSGLNNSDGSGSGAGDDASCSEADKDGSGSSSRGSVGAAGPALPMPVGPAGPALPMP
ncbi:hypothetical protein FOMPIDRAFT_117979, partial [Fomitopsis schrenkii]